MTNELITQLLNDSVIVDSICNRCREIFEYYRDDKLNLSLIEKIYLQGVVDGVFISLKVGID